MRFRHTQERLKEVEEKHLLIKKWVGVESELKIGFQQVDIISNIIEASRSDYQLATLFENVQEYAQLYLIAKQRQKGCDGMGEVSTLRDEFVYYLDKMIEYCKEKGYLSDDITYEVDSIALQMTKIKNG